MKYFMNKLPIGSYKAIASGYQTTFEVNGIFYECLCVKGIRGINIPDIVTVTESNIFSAKLGQCLEYDRCHK